MLRITYRTPVYRKFISFAIVLAIVTCANTKFIPSHLSQSQHQLSVDACIHAPSAAPSAPVVDVKTIKLMPRRVLIVGDSEACAVGFIAKNTVQKINDEANQPRDIVSTVCKSSTVTSYWGEQGHLREAILRYPNPDVIIVFLGTNHYWQVSKSPDVSKILKEISDAHAHCVWVGNVAVKGKTWPINKLLHDAVSHQCIYFDTEAADIPLADGIHPNNAGSIKWLRLIWPVVPLKYEE